MREDEQAQGQQSTLTERVGRIERILALSGFGGEEAGLNYRDEGDMIGRAKHSVLGREDCDSTNQCSERATALEEITQRIGIAITNIHRTAQRLEVVGNRTMGVLPEAGLGAAASDKQREPDGTLEAAFRTLDYLDGSIEHLQQRATRLERL